MPPPREKLPKAFPHHTDPYAGIALENYVGKYSGKVLFLTGASKGLGEHTAKAFARSGASIFMCARSAGGLERVKKEIIAEGGENVKIESAVVDVSKEEDVKNAVEKAVEVFGKIDFVISNAGVSGDTSHKIGESDVSAWSSVINVNLIGSYIVARYTIPELLKTKGYLVFVGSTNAQARVPTLSGYCISKHALNRLCEFVVKEYGPEGLKAFSFHPGSCTTDITEGIPQFRSLLVDSWDLGPYTELRLVSGSEDWLSGRFISANWDLDELAKHKESILENDAFKNRLALPPSLL